jgi:hypothetical protein
MKTTFGRWRILGLVAAVLIVVGAWPVRYLASPRWEVWVVNDEDHPISKVNVRLVYQNYSAEGQSHEVTFETDKNGRVLFPQHYESACVFQRVLYTLFSASAGVHASFGRHAYVYAFGGGYEGSALEGKYLVDWRGSPDSMESRIVAKHVQI